jgi:hypothetical protein
MWDGQVSFEVLNLYALVVFLGWAHFFYAWQGQWKASGKLTQGRRALYWGFVLVAMTLLVIVRNWLGLAIFSLFAWVYNIAHFVKAEIFFAGAKKRSSFYSPVIAFAWFTLVLFRVGIMARPSIAIGGSLLLAAGLLLAGDWRVLEEEQVRLPVLTFFLLGESLVWTAYGRYMSPEFRVGIYVFHIAGASFFHYLSSYFYASGKSFLTQPAAIVGVNVGFFMCRLCCGARTCVELGIGLAWA